ncbi:helix-turn-helix domain-containing protein [Paenibacillus piri]|uniref:Response regulator n=1 Tax=Paenibacillus piri TaxID=2547395 RepID=A0A4V2ZT54_9BACL|nr:helix-turn-helix domain-containing protein [Paenibacillus piri]TDF95754.1 response regulator [Paenibacillus piri]
MYRLLLVEDEMSTRKWLTHKIEWETFGFQIIGVAEDGEMAWAQIQEDPNIDVVMTDVRMPHMDGIELISRIRSAALDIEVLISSGYGEFDYAQKAIRLGVAVYLLKPVTKEQLKLEFERLKIELDEKHMRKNELLEAGRIRKEKESLTKTEIFQRCLVQEEEMPELAQRLELLDKRFLRSPYLTIVASIDHYSHFTMSYSMKDQRLCSFIVMNILSEITQSYQPLEAVFLEPNRHVFFIPLNGGKCAADYTRELGYQFQQALKKYLKVFDITISVGGSGPVDGAEGLIDGYRQAVKALEHKFFTGVASIINRCELTVWDEQCQYSLDWEKRIISELKRNDIVSAYDELDRFFDLYTRQGTAEGVRWVAGELLTNITKQLTDLKSVHVNSERMRKLLNELEQMETLVELKVKMKQLIRFIESMFEVDSLKLSPVAKGIEYIKLNLNRDLSLQEVAEYAGISPSYFSTLFKQEQGRNFIEYVISLRMEEAREILEKTQLTIIEIGEKIGYRNYRYFTRVFKEHVGLTPSQYRDKVIKKLTG